MTEVRKLWCALPYRVSGDAVEVLHDHATVPAAGAAEGAYAGLGGPFETAEREAWEEAGVRGAIDVLPMGGFDHQDGAGEVEHVLVYPLDVAEEAATWPEDDRRKRRWTSAREAARLIAPELAPLLTDFATDTDAMSGDGAGASFERDKE